MGDCTLTRYYDEPTDPVVIISVSLFYFPDYKRIRRGEAISIGISRQYEFYNSLSYNIKQFQEGYYPKNWRFRLYWDKSLFIDKRLPNWEQILKEWMKIPQVQLIQYNCPSVFNETGRHADLFGMLMRFQAFFDNITPWSVVFVMDADNIITPERYKDMRNFENNPDMDVHAFCTPYELGSHTWKNKETPCFFRGGLIGSKIHFKPELWKELFDDLNHNQELKDRIEALSSCHREVFCAMEGVDSFQPYKFGFDEIFINSYLKSLWKQKKAHYDITLIRPNMGMAGTHFQHFLQWVHSKGNETQKKALHDFLQNMPPDYNTMDKFNKNFPIYVQQYKNTKNVESVHELYKTIHKNFPLLKKMGIMSIMSDYFIEFWEHYPATSNVFQKLPHIDMYLRHATKMAPKKRNKSHTKRTLPKK